MNGDLIIKLRENLENNKQEFPNLMSMEVEGYLKIELPKEFNLFRDGKITLDDLRIKANSVIRNTYRKKNTDFPLIHFIDKERTKIDFYPQKAKEKFIRV